MKITQNYYIKLGIKQILVKLFILIDIGDTPPPKPPAPTHPIIASKEQKPEPVQEEPEPLKSLPEEDEEKTEKQDEVFKDEQNENDSKQETEPVAAAPPRPEPVKRQAPRIPLVPGPGGSALLAEMKMRQSKDKVRNFLGKFKR